MSKLLSCALQVMFFSFFLALEVHALTISADTKSLEQRVRAAEIIFVGELINRRVDGDWVCAELLVVVPLHNATQSKTVAVTWRAMIGGRPIYDLAEGLHGIAILTDKHNGRYWLRSDKFEPLQRLDEVKELIGLIQ